MLVQHNHRSLYELMVNPLRQLKIDKRKKKSTKRAFWLRGKKSTKRAVLVLAVLFGVGGWSGSKFGFYGPNFMGNPNLVSVRSGRPGLERYPIFPLLGGNSRFRCTTLNLIADLESTQYFGLYRGFPGQI